MQNSRANENPSFPWRMLWIIVLLAFAVRLGWVLTQTKVIENEGAEYARIAQNLRNGAGYVGTMGGPQLLFPPLYPFLIAAITLVSNNAEAAARTVSVVAGTLLIIPIFLISFRFYGRRAAFISGLITALYPVLIALSASTYSECIYATLIMAGLLFGVHWQKSGKISDAALAGIFLGLAYLTRPEAIAYPVVLFVVVISSRLISHGNWRRTLWQASIMLVFVVALTMLYVAYRSLSVAPHRTIATGR